MLMHISSVCHIHWWSIHAYASICAAIDTCKNLHEYMHVCPHRWDIYSSPEMLTGIRVSSYLFGGGRGWDFKIFT